MRRSLEHRLEALEADYRAGLAMALQRCADGEWGLFGHNDGVIDRLAPTSRKRLRNAAVDELLDLGARIERRRSTLGYAAPFGPHQRLMRVRSRRTANTPGEPKLAQQWLDETRRE